MTNVLAIAKAGINVLTATSPNDFIFHSSYNTFKILAQGLYTSQLVDSSEKTFTVAHGMSTIPSVYALAKFADGYVCQPNDKQRDDTTPPIEHYWRVEVNATNIYFIFNRDSASDYTVSFKFYLFETPL